MTAALVAVAVLAAGGIAVLERGGRSAAAPGGGAGASVSATASGFAPISSLTSSATTGSSGSTVSSTSTKPTLGSAIGVLLAKKGSSLTQTCTAVVVDSTTGDIVATAAHCLNNGDSFVFAPGYRSGREPYGLWTVTSSHTDPAWQDHGDEDDDYAFLTVARRPSGTTTMSVQQAVGGMPIGLSPLIGDTVTVRGYPDELDGRPLTCRTQVRATREFPTVDCAGFAAGTSGGPLISGYDRRTGQGTVVGLIGGLETGGCTDDISYASPFTNDTQAVLVAAEHAAPSSPLPRSMPSSSC